MLCFAVAAAEFNISNWMRGTLNFVEVSPSPGRAGPLSMEVRYVAVGSILDTVNFFFFFLICQFGGVGVDDDDDGIDAS